MTRMVIGFALALIIAHSQVRCLRADSFNFVDAMDAIGKTYIRQSGCLDEAHVTMDELEAYANSGGGELVERTPTLKRFAACMFEYNRIVERCKVREKKFDG